MNQFEDIKVGPIKTYTMDEFNELAKDFQEDQEDNRSKMMDALKKDLSEVSEKLKLKQLEKDNMEARLKVINEEMQDLEAEVRAKWEPYLGADSAKLTLENGIVLSARPTVNVSIENNDTMTEWFLNHGYGSVMKYQIHNQTMKKIAREEFEKGTTIPGLKYSKFTVIKVK